MFLAQGGRARRQGDLSPVLEKQKPATRSACHVVSLLAGTVQIHGEKSPSSEASAAPAILLYQAWALVGPPTSAAPPCTRGLANGQAAPQTPVFLSGQDGGGGEAVVTLGQPHLSRQDLNTVDVTKLTPLSHEVISRQATINIGTGLPWWRSG